MTALTTIAAALVIALLLAVGFGLGHALNARQLVEARAQRDRMREVLKEIAAGPERSRAAKALAAKTLTTMKLEKEMK